MAISNEKVEDIQELTATLGELIVGLNPETEKEWDAFSKLVDAHKSLRKIETDGLRQLQLPLGSEPDKIYRKDCPRCEGKGQWADPVAPLGPFYPCTCFDISKKAWPQVKKEWEESLAPAEI